MKVTVDTCTRRRDDKFLVTYRMPGAIKGSAVSDREVPPGRTVVIQDGKVIG